MILLRVARAAAVCAALWTNLAGSVAAQPAGIGWAGAWATAPQAVAQHPDAPAFNRAPSVAGRTVRQIVYLRVAGRQLRVRLSNSYGPHALTIERASVALSGGGAAVQAATLRPLTFGGQPFARIAPGAELDSDPVALDVPAGAALAVSFYTREASPPTTWHKVAGQVAFLSASGDQTLDASAAPFRQKVTNTLWLAGVSVAPVAPVHVVVAIGDSITDGLRSTLNANRRWPDVLTRRLEAAGRRDVSVLNLGISGNRLLHDSACYGERLVGRFARDALEQPGVRTVVVQVGTNDINFGYVPPHGGLDCDVPHVIVSAPEMIAGYERLIAAARAHGVQILGTTIPPGKMTGPRESVRLSVNQWVRTSGAFDGVIDFDAALRDPSQPARMLPRFDSGDGTHPSDAGYAAMAEAVPIPLISGAVR
ncbi:G-D-S-L family lipolytic protein [Pandoraea terrae]|uniref:G-D-S-L family lipolytic protein n=1 Tax=Pandoraea terrae TaxID=1537710 RepID=A0A5E4TTB2_9BURK|nr:SGNH/GDSL hydrolase family protein [Pandoraea terrae]VVD90413.1 G-D-S-L family lipolytic protein [Pandoraea terrae]